MYNKRNRDREIIEEMKHSISQMTEFVVDLYNLNQLGQERYRNLTWLAIEELAQCGSLEDTAEVIQMEDGEGGVQAVRVEGPLRNLVNVLKDEIMEVGELEWRSDRFYHALTAECEFLLLQLTSYACRELVNELSPVMG